MNSDQELFLNKKLEVEREKSDKWYANKRTEIIVNTFLGLITLAFMGVLTKVFADYLSRVIK